MHMTASSLGRYNAANAMSTLNKTLLNPVVAGVTITQFFLAKF